MVKLVLGGLKAYSILVSLELACFGLKDLFSWPPRTLDGLVCQRKDAIFVEGSPLIHPSCLWY